MYNYDIKLVSFMLAIGQIGHKHTTRGETVILNFIIMIGNSFLPYVGMTIPVQTAEYESPESDHRGMTVIQPGCVDAVASTNEVFLRADGFDRDTCLDACGSKQMNRAAFNAFYA